MKKIDKYFLIAASLFTALSLAGCNSELNDSPLSTLELASFIDEKPINFFESDGWTNNDVFNVWWNKENIEYNNKGALLTITNRENGSSETNDQYNGGEIRSYQYFGYGDYQVKMKPAKKDGTASTFFVCTGPYENDINGNPNPHDEIDIEFLGKDTTKVQFNYFVNGVGGHEYMYNLGFDASKEVHEYGFRWNEKSITWFVDNKPVYKVNQSNNKPLPNTPGRILMNYWCGTKNAESWMGKYSNPGEEGALYEEIRTSATAIGDINNDIHDYESLLFESTEVYEVTPSNMPSEEFNVRYEDVLGQSYKNIQADISALAKDNNECGISFVNNGQSELKIRVDIQGTNVVSTGENSSTDACNISSVNIGGTNSYTNKEWGGSFITILPNREAKLIIEYSEDLKQGSVKNILIYLDSSTDNNQAHSNNVTIKNIYFLNNKD